MANYNAYLGENTAINFDNDLVDVTFYDANRTSYATILIKREIINQKYYYNIDTSDLECAGIFLPRHISGFDDAEKFRTVLDTPPKPVVNDNSTEMAFVSIGENEDDIKYWNLTLNLGDVPEPDILVTFDISTNWDYENNGISVDWSWDYDSSSVSLMPANYTIYVYERKIGNNTDTGNLIETIDISYGTDEHYNQHIVYTNGKSGYEYLFRINTIFNILSGDGIGDNLYINALSEHVEWIMSALKLATKTSSGWVKGKPFVKTLSGWEEAQKIFAKTSYGWKELIN